MVLTSIHRLQKVFTHKVCRVRAKLHFSVIGRSLEAKVCAPWRRDCSEKVYFHSIFSFIPPEESKEVSVFFIDEELMKHPFHITGDGYPLLAETAEDTC